MWCSGGEREVEGKISRLYAWLEITWYTRTGGLQFSLRGAPKLEGHLGEGLGRPYYKPILCGEAVRLQTPSNSQLTSPGNPNLFRDGRKEVVGGTE